MSFITISYIPSAAAAPQSYVIQEGMPVSTFLEDVQGINNFSNISVEVNGVPANLQDDLEAGDTVAILQKKTASGATR